MAHGIEEFTKYGNRRRASYDLLATWIFDAWKQAAQPAFIHSLSMVFESVYTSSGMVTLKTFILGFEIRFWTKKLGVLIFAGTNFREFCDFCKI